MRNWRASIACCCLMALPLAACSGSGPVAQQSRYSPNVADTVLPGGAAERVAYTGPAAPAAVLVFLPGTATFGDTQTDALADVPSALWADQGLGMVRPRITDALLAQDRDMDLALRRMLTYVRAIADAPIWLVGSGPEIQNALASLPPGHGPISGVVVTSMSSPAGTCSKTVVYSSNGKGVPTVQVRSSGNACEGVSPSMRPPVFEQTPEPSVPSGSPHTILVRNGQAPASRVQTNGRPLVQLIADRIKQSPSG